MKLILFATFLCALVTIIPRQTPVSPSLSEQDWDKLFSALESEDWDKSAELSRQYLAKQKNEDAEKSLAQ